MSGAPAKKSLGQNFLRDRSFLTPILHAAQLSPADKVLEIGPGKGALTEALAEQTDCLVAVELDERLIEPLRQHFAPQPHVHVIHADILEHAPAELIAEACSPTLATAPAAAIAYKVVANLPYYITSAVLRHLLEANPPPTLAVVMVQWEVAQRICAAPGDLSLLAVSVQFYATPRLIQRVPARAFSPQPKVDSAIVQLLVHPQPVIDVAPDHFFAVVRAGFSQKRKQLHNSLAAGLHLERRTVQQWLEKAGIDPMRRAETLSLVEWGILCQCAPLAASVDAWR